MVGISVGTLDGVPLQHHQLSDSKKNQSPSLWQRWQNRWRTQNALQRAPTQMFDYSPTDTKYDRRNAKAAAINSCIAAAGVLWFPSLHLVATAGLLYMSIPAAQQAYDALVVERRGSAALVETLAMAGILVRGADLVGSLGFSLYYLGRAALDDKESQLRWQQAWQPPQVVRVQRDGIECQITVDDLQPDDHVVLCSGEMAPVAGRVVEGMAWIDRRPTTSQEETHILEVDSTIEPANLVLVGRITIEIQD